MMRLDLTGRHVDITPSLRQLIDRKLAKLDRHLPGGLLSAQVVVAREKYRHVVEMTLHARGDHMLHAVGRGAAWPVALKGVGQALEQQVLKLKGKWKEGKRRGAGPRVLAAKAAVVTLRGGPANSRGADGRGLGEDAQPRLLRSSRYPVKPMSVEDAARRVESSDDAFIVFRNPETEAINIVYRRKDGNLGLIEPEA